MAGTRVLMVEGPDDAHVVKHICGRRALGEIECIKPYGGKDALIDGIGVRLKESDIGALGIILDADTDLHARWQSVATHLMAAGYGNVPTRPEPDGTIIESLESSLLPRVGVWLMPDNKLLVRKDILFVTLPKKSLSKSPCRLRRSTRPVRGRSRSGTGIRPRCICGGRGGP